MRCLKQRAKYERVGRLLNRYFWLLACNFGYRLAILAIGPQFWLLARYFGYRLAILTAGSLFFLLDVEVEAAAEREHLMPLQSFVGHVEDTAGFELCVLVLGDAISQIRSAVPRRLQECVAPVVFAKSVIAEVLLPFSCIESLVQREAFPVSPQVAHKSQRTVPCSLPLGPVAVGLYQHASPEVQLQPLSYIVAQPAHEGMPRDDLMYGVVVVVPL